MNFFKSMALALAITNAPAILSMQQPPAAAEDPEGTICCSASDTITRIPRVIVPSKFIRLKDDTDFFLLVTKEENYKCYCPKEGLVYLEPVASIECDTEQITLRGKILEGNYQKDGTITDFMLDITPHITFQQINKTWSKNTVLFDAERNKYYTTPELLVFVPTEFDEKIHTQTIPCLIIVGEFPVHYRACGRKAN